MDLYSYMQEIMKIPIDHKPIKKYNGSSCRRVCAKARQFSAYRSVCLRENRVRQRINELIALIRHADRQNTPAASGLREAELRELVLEFGRLTLKRRELEQMCDKIESEFVRQVVIHRYFEGLSRRVPTWQQTAAELGIAVNGEELRRYICASLNAGC